MRVEYAADGWVSAAEYASGRSPAAARSSLSRQRVAWPTCARLPASGTRSAPAQAAVWALACAPAGAASATTAVARRVTARRRENMVPSHRAPPAAPSAGTTRLDGCPSIVRPRRRDGVEERVGAGAVLGGPGARLRADRLRVDAVAGERRAPVADPALDDRGRHLGVELQADAAPGAERVRADRAARELDRAGRQRERVVVPREPRAGRDGAAVGRLELEPADLGGRRGAHLAAERRRERLAAEAQAEHRDPRLVGLAQEGDLRRDPRVGRGVDGVLGAERGDRAIPPRIGPRARAQLLRAQRHDAVPALAGPLLEQSRRRVGLLLDDAEVERHLPLDAEGAPH